MRDELRLAAVAARVVAWHNRHPLARRITPAHVHAVGYVALPFVSDQPGAPESDAAPPAPAVAAAPAEDGAAGGSLRERALARARQQAGQGAGLPVLDAVVRPPAAAGPLPVLEALQPDFSEHFIDPLHPLAVARFAARHGQVLAQPPSDGPVREVRADGSRPAAQRVPVYLLTAVVETGTRKSRVLMDMALAGPVLGRRIHGGARLGGAAALALGLVAGPAWLLLPEADGPQPPPAATQTAAEAAARTPDDAAAPASATAALQAAEPASATALATPPDAGAAVLAPPTGADAQAPATAPVGPQAVASTSSGVVAEVVAPLAAPVAAPAAMAFASAPAHAAAPTVAEAPGPQAVTPSPAARRAIAAPVVVGPLNLPRVAPGGPPGIVPVLTDAQKLQARQARQQAAEGRSPPTAAPEAGAAAAVAPARTEGARAAPGAPPTSAAPGAPPPHAASGEPSAVGVAGVPSPHDAAARPAPTAVAALPPVASKVEPKVEPKATPTPAAAPPRALRFAVSTRALRTRAEAEQVQVAMRSLLLTVDATPPQVQVLPQGEDWRVVAWPFASRAAADKAHALLVSRGMRLAVVEF